MKRSLLALAIGLAFGLATTAMADEQKPAADKKAACCASKSADGAKVCDKEAKASCCKAGEKGAACCPGECCKKESCNHKEKTAPSAQTKGNEAQKDAASCCGESCCKAA